MHFILQQTSDPTMTLNDFWEIYKDDLEKRLWKTTMKQKEYVMKDKVLSYLGNMPINAITTHMICKWQEEMIDKGFKPTYLKTINNQLSAILNYAVRFYELRSNPCHKACIRAKLAEKKQEIQNEQKNKQHTHSQNKDRGAR